MDKFHPMAHRALPASPELARRVEMVARYASLNRAEIAPIIERAALIARDYRAKKGKIGPADIDGMQLLLDVSIAGMDRQMHMLRWLMSDASDFVHDLNKIHLHIDRQSWTLSLAVPLLFASNGERVTAISTNVP